MVSHLCENIEKSVYCRADCFERLVKSGISLNESYIDDCGYKMYLIHKIIMCDKIELLIYYNHYGGKYNWITSEGETILHFAVVHNSKKCLKYCLENGIEEIDINYIDKHGYTALQIAVDEGEIETTKILLEYGANPNIALQFKLKNRCYPIHIAYQTSRNGDEILELLLKYDADPNKEDNIGRTLLHYTIMFGDLNMMKKLVLKYKVKIDIVNKNYYDPVCFSCLYRNFDMMNFLLKNGDKLEKKNINEKNFIYKSCIRSHKGLKLLLENGGDINYKFSENKSLLYKLIKNGPTIDGKKNINLLLNLGVDVNICPEKTSILHETIKSNFDINEFKLLINSGAKIFKKNYEGITLKNFAIMYSCLGELKYVNILEEEYYKYNILKVMGIMRNLRQIKLPRLVLYKICIKDYFIKIEDFEKLYKIVMNKNCIEINKIFLLIFIK